VTPTQLTCEYRKVQTQTRDGGQSSPLAKFGLASGSTAPQQIA
jgi:hypothetical protein